MRAAFGQVLFAAWLSAPAPAQAGVSLRWIPAIEKTLPGIKEGPTAEIAGRLMALSRGFEGARIEEFEDSDALRLRLSSARDLPEAELRQLDYLAAHAEVLDPVIANLEAKKTAGESISPQELAQAINASVEQAANEARKVYARYARAAAVGPEAAGLGHIEETEREGERLLLYRRAYLDPTMLRVLETATVRLRGLADAFKRHEEARIISSARQTAQAIPESEFLPRGRRLTKDDAIDLGLMEQRNGLKEVEAAALTSPDPAGGAEPETATKPKRIYPEGFAYPEVVPHEPFAGLDALGGDPRSPYYPYYLTSAALTLTKALRDDLDSYFLKGKFAVADVDAQAWPLIEKILRSVEIRAKFAQLPLESAQAGELARLLEPQARRFLELVEKDGALSPSEKETRSKNALALINGLKRYADKASEGGAGGTSPAAGQDPAEETIATIVRTLRMIQAQMPEFLRALDVFLQSRPHHPPSPGYEGAKKENAMSKTHWDDMRLNVDALVFSTSATLSKPDLLRWNLRRGISVILKHEPTTALKRYEADLERLQNIEESQKRLIKEAFQKLHVTLISLAAQAKRLL